MLSDRQSLILCGVVVIGVFISGLLDILDNYIVKTILTIIFLMILVNFFMVYSKSKKKKEDNLK
ncbi:hypothetical protein QLS71_011380 [Mariniflexile litorale]|uniref:Uncharacterized protein n=1 Tax=Mariniflexile litorale TaxID=3045158 RepID=A0AAU7EBK9_9FLAO|nr:hypothetical protein [Mariniflexile sp. KMM 9835]MDQ8212951.1 hypothetical protein [Mariniflexile sp. KMM 9835]